MSATAILLLSCPDQKGIVAEIASFIYQYDGNIVHSDQHTDFETNTFFMRIEWELEGFRIPREKIAQAFSFIADKFRMEWRLVFSDEVPRVAIMVSKFDHCLYDLLLKWQSKEIRMDIPLIVSNHEDLRSVAEYYRIPYFCFPVNAENKKEVEEKEIKLFQDYRIDTVVLARYMQVLSPDFIAVYPNRIINIHHSFLPAFVGAKPYHQAYARGVKLIGATSHYVTEELDNGPIIVQDVIGVSHRDSLSDMINKGKEVEKRVLSRAVKLHVENKVLVFHNKTVVFD
ncbi:MAG: formyltetrahydrofolate deformylase [Brevinematales bacterium]|nr:formyltetrahydrofolate deformylase [Brevinematales bacterium]